MFLAFITFLTAFAVEGLGTFVSIVGLTSFLGLNPVIMALAAALDAGKLLTVTILYKYWASLNKLMRIYMVFATIITMAITSAGAFGYLSAAFQKTIIPTKEGMVQEQTLVKERERLEVRKNELSARKTEIDKQIASLPSDTVKGRRQLIKDFKAESQDILKESKVVQDRLFQIDKEIADTSIKNIDTQAHAGPIIFVAQTFDIPLEQAVKYVILMIIFVFDPLAVVLVLAGNFLLERRNSPKEDRRHIERRHEHHHEEEAKVDECTNSHICKNNDVFETEEIFPVLPPKKNEEDVQVKEVEFSEEPKVVEKEKAELELLPVEQPKTEMKEISVPVMEDNPKKMVIRFNDDIGVKFHHKKNIISPSLELESVDEDSSMHFKDDTIDSRWKPAPKSVLDIYSS